MQETELAPAIRGMRTSIPDVYATEQQSTPEEMEEDKWLREPWLKEPLSDSAKQIEPSALEELKKLADLAVKKTEERQKDQLAKQQAMKQLEALANNQKDEATITPEKQPTAFMPALPRQINPITPIPPSVLPTEEPAQEKSQERNSDPMMKPNLSYYMKDISPLILIWGAIGEHMSKYRNNIPLCVYVSKRLITLLADDIKRIMGEDVLFYGHVPFPTPEGTVPISVRIKESMGISVHKVECIS
jgi:hypothetical protein